LTYVRQVPIDTDFGGLAAFHNQAHWATFSERVATCRNRCRRDIGRKESIMVRWAQLLGAASLTVALASSSGASAQTAHKPTKRQAPAGHQIIVRPGKSYLSAGTGANVGSQNKYVTDTFNQPPATDGTFAGMRGRERLMNQFNGPGIPLFRF
jgi:hypothetical protein